MDVSDDELPPEALPLDEEPGPVAPSAARGGDATAATAAAVTAALNGAPVPVTLITGFLGAGKTTLVRHILTARHGRRIAVVLNEYGGEGDIEAAFVRTEGGADAPAPHWVELANGCLCCSVKGEFLQAIEALVASGLAPGGSGGGGPQAEQPQQGEGQQHQARGAVEAVLVEASGLADPGPVVAALWGDEELEPAALLDGVVTVVDAAHIGRQLAERRTGGAANEAQVQVALADVVLLNKTDLATEEQLVEIEQTLRRLNPAARIARCERGAVDLSLLFGRGGYRLRDARGAPLLLAAAGGEAAGGGAAAGTAAAAAAAAGVADGADGGGIGGAAANLAAGLEAFTDAAAAAGGADGDGGNGDDGDGNAPQCCDHGHHSHDGGHCHNSSDPAASAQQTCASHDASIVTVALRCPRPLDRARFERWLEGLLWNGDAGGDGGGDTGGGDGGGGGPSCEVLRLKGLVDVAGSDRAHMVQAVYEVYDAVPGPPWAALEARWAEERAAYAEAQQQQQEEQQQKQGAPRPRRPPPPGRGTRLVVIGRRLDARALQRGLDACAAAAALEPPH